MAKNPHTNKETDFSKGKFAHGDVRNIHSVSKMPKATNEQLHLVKLLSKSTDDSEYQFKLQQVREITACSEDAAVFALHDADGDVQKAIENVLDKNSNVNDWHVTMTKKSKTRRLTEAAKVKANNAAPLDQKLDEQKPENEQNDALSAVGDQSKKNHKKAESKRSSKNAPELPQPSENVPSEEPVQEEKEKWDTECAEWKGETIEIVNSTSDFNLNIHEDSELLRLATTEPEDVPEEIPEIEVKEEAHVVEIPPTVTTSKELCPEEISACEESKNEESGSIQDVRSSLFAKFARSQPPAQSFIPNAAVFFAPGAKVAGSNERPVRSARQSSSVVQHEENHVLENDRKADAIQQIEHPEVPPEPLKAEPVHEKKPKPTKPPVYNMPDPLKSSDQCNLPPVINSFLQPVPKLQPDLQTDQPYAALTDAYAKLHEQAAPQARATTQTVNSFDTPTTFNNYLLDELSHKMSKVGMDGRVGKADAFTQSLSSNQPEPSPVTPPYHSTVPLLKHSLPQTSQLGKPAPTGAPPSTTHQTMPTTQPQMHPAMHPAIPQLLSHFQTGFPMFNLHGAGSGAAAPQLVDLDHLQALQQQHQRMLFEMQQQQQSQQQHQPQTNAAVTEQSIGNNTIDVMSSSKSSANPMNNHVTAASAAAAGIRPDLLASTLGHPMLNQAAATFLPYSTMLFMNGYPNAFLNQQQTTQASGNASQMSGHGGSPLTAHQSGQQSQQQPPYMKPVNTAGPYSGYPGMRQSTFDDMSDLTYSNLSKQVGYKHNSGGVTNAPQGIYGAQPSNQNQQQQAGNGGNNNPDMASIASKLQQQGGGGGQPQAPQQQPQAHSHFSQMYHHPSPYMAMAAAAAAQQQHHPGAAGVQNGRPQH